MGDFYLLAVAFIMSSIVKSHRMFRAVLIRYYERSGDSYSGSSDEYNFSDPQQYYHDSELRHGSQRAFYNSHPPRRKFSPNLSSRHGKHRDKRHFRKSGDGIFGNGTVDH